MGTDGICYWLVGQRAAHFVAVAPQDGGLLRLAPRGKLLRQPRLANARLAADEADAALPGACLLVRALQPRYLFLAAHQRGMQNAVGVKLACIRRWLFRFALPVALRHRNSVVLCGYRFKRWRDRRSVMIVGAGRWLFPALRLLRSDMSIAFGMGVDVLHRSRRIPALQGAAGRTCIHQIDGDAPGLNGTEKFCGLRQRVG